MNTFFFHPVRGGLNFLLATLAAIVSTLGVGLVLQAFNPFTNAEDPQFFRLFVGSSLVLGPALLYFIQESRDRGLRLLGLTLVVYVGAAQVLQHFETIAFNFLFQFSPAQLAYLMVSQALTALILVPLIITIAGGWRKPSSVPEDRTAMWLPATAGSFWIRTGLLAALWYVCYMGAGFFIADPITHDYYAAKLPDLASINQWLPLLQLVRGVLWTLLFVLAVRLMNRPLAESGLIAGLLFGVFQASGLLLPNPSMPAEMRLSHLPEIVLSLVWQGSLVVAILGWRRRERSVRSPS